MIELFRLILSRSAEIFSSVITRLIFFIERDEKIWEEEDTNTENEKLYAESTEEEYSLIESRARRLMSNR